MSRARHVLALAAVAVPVAALAQPRAEQRASHEADHAALPPPPLPALAIPPGWEPQPAVALAARTAAAPHLGPRAMSADAWGNPLLGCHAVVVGVNLDLTFTPAALLGQLRTALGGAGAVEGWADDQWLASARLRGARWHGELRAAITSGNRPRLEAIACFHDDRAPDRCQAACAPLLAALPVPTSPSQPRTP